MKKLKEILSDMYKIGAAAGLLQWDQETYMPEGGGAFRADVLACLNLAAHKLATGSELRDALARHIDPESGECINITLSDTEKRMLLLVQKELK